MTTHQIELSDPKNSVKILSGFLSEVLEGELVPFEVDNAMQLAGEEAIVNIFKHGYKGSEGPVIVKCTIEHGRVTLIIQDEAPFFNPLSLPPPDVDATLEDRKIGGLGVYLIRSLMDDVRYEQTEKGNCLIMEKAYSS